MHAIISRKKRKKLINLMNCLGMTHWISGLHIILFWEKVKKVLNKELQKVLII